MRVKKERGRREGSGRKGEEKQGRDVFPEPTWQPNQLYGTNSRGLAYVCARNPIN